ncbi:histidine phosphatase family protein [Rossellomorea aquimaris]|uniref:histidine phosphatase family protein n=1 Tax=Rossellomorea aquimaris TaxID=189382 RepID=UPI001CD7EB1B|nr:histidine phosphatase family protein [Rossellomorea aquimaris]MCA1054738.1 histidine phosphatase family protein [Rossellomorea aquimaris]
MKTLYIVRHAKAEGQDFHAPLTREGEEQAGQLASFLKEYPVEAIFSSPFKRTLQTIQPFADCTGIPIKEDERLGERILSERDHPDWKEMLRKTFEDFSLSFPGGESNEQGLGRASSFIEDMLKSKEDHIVVVSHGNLTTLLLRYFDEKYGYDELFALSNPDVYLVEVDEGLIRRIWEP